MDKDKIDQKLKEFYLLETFQVQYYQAQLSESRDVYYRKAFEKMVKIEAGHAEFFEQKLWERGIEKPPIIEPFYKAAGRLLGESIELAGRHNTLRLGVALENKAIESYRDFIIKDWGDPSLRDTLLDYLIDEEFHTLWMQDFMKNLVPEQNTNYF